MVDGLEQIRGDVTVESVCRYDQTAIPEFENVLPEGNRDIQGFVERVDPGNTRKPDRIALGLGPIG
ncbi:MAG: hypothetical protein VX910_01395 [Candidatus Latescibacterota bacterium]|nr:hypothetical protein [Candidatus Latescibacterota bacterium]